MYISKNITKLVEYDDIIFYKTHCGCGSDSCIHSLILEVDDDLGTITMELYARVNYDFWNEDGLRWWEVCLKRLKVAIKLLFTGNIRQEAIFIFKDKESIRDYVSALLDGLAKLQVCQKHKKIIVEDVNEEDRHL